MDASVLIPNLVILVVVLASDHKARFQPVKMGERVGPNWIVSEGLQPGELAVTDGAVFLSNMLSAPPSD